MAIFPRPWVASSPFTSAVHAIWRLATWLPMATISLVSPGIAYITEEGIAFHGTYWHKYWLPRSHGCINLTTQAANWLYRWTMPAVPPSDQYSYQQFGTYVDIIE